MSFSKEEVKKRKPKNRRAGEKTSKNNRWNDRKKIKTKKIKEKP